MYTRYDEMMDDYLEFDKEHPKVWEYFVKFTLESLERGFKVYSVNAIFERIRWKTDQPNVKGSSTFKLSNNHRPFYARRFMKEYPQYGNFFVLHEQTSHLKPAVKQPDPLW